MDNPLISIIIQFLTQADFIREAVKSFLNKTDQDFEIIIVINEIIKPNLNQGFYQKNLTCTNENSVVIDKVLRYYYPFNRHRNHYIATFLINNN
tara:strand:- start:1030 stop:1311 length:282 start_codon:yes stop_codon:yes gene_type:complete